MLVREIQARLRGVSLGRGSGDLELLVYVALGIARRLVACI